MSERIRIVFLSFYIEAWDALADIYRKMLADPRFEPIVVSIPRRLTGETDYSGEERVSEFYDAQGIEHLRFDFADSTDGTAKLRELAPDYVFLNYPWQRNYQPGYRAEVLSEFTKVCQVPYYSFALVNEPGDDGVDGRLLRSPALADQQHRLCLVELGDALVEVAHRNVLRDVDEATSCSFLVGHRNRVFQVAENDVDGRNHLGKFCDDLFELRREEVNDSTGPKRNLAERFGCTDGEGFEEVFCTAHAGKRRGCAFRP